MDTTSTLSAPIVYSAAATLFSAELIGPEGVTSNTIATADDLAFEVGLWLGGLEAPYEYTPADREVVDLSRENAPDLSMRPPGPFLRDLASDGAEQVLVFGLAQDFLGYLVPEFDYELHPVSPYLEEAPGEHYEETNSVGLHGWPTIRAEMEALIAWPDPR